MAKRKTNLKTETNPSDKLITCAEAARQVGMHRSTIWNYVRGGVIPVVRTPSGIYRMWQSDFDAMWELAKRLKKKREAESKDAYGKDA